MILWASDLDSGAHRHWDTRSSVISLLLPPSLLCSKYWSPLKKKKKKKNNIFQREPLPALINSILSDLARPRSWPKKGAGLSKSKVPQVHKQSSSASRFPPRSWDENKRRANLKSQADPGVAEKGAGKALYFFLPYTFTPHLLRPPGSYLLGAP